MNRVVHFEIHADNPDRAQKFYESVFGWTFQHMGPDMGNYRLITTGQDAPGINGGLMARNARATARGQSPNAFVCIVGVDNIDRYMDKAESAGAKPHTDKMEVPGVGQLRYYEDTEGNVFGMIQPVMP